MAQIAAERIISLGYDDSEALGPVLRALQLVDVRPDDALQLTGQVLAPGWADTDLGARGLAGMLRAGILCDRGDYHGALSAIRASAGALRLADLPVEVVRSRLSSIRVVREMGEVEQSVVLADSMLAAWEAQGLTAPPAAEDMFASVSARIQLERALSLIPLGRLDEALQDLDHVWNRFRAVDDAVMVAVTEHGRARAYLGFGLIHRALEEMWRVHASFETLDRPLDAARCCLTIAKCLIHMDRGAEAVQVLERARAVFERHGAVPDLAALGLVLGRALLAVGLAWDAKAESRQAVQHFLDLGRFDDAGRAHLETGFAYMLVGDHEGLRGELEVADRLLRDTTDWRTRVGVQVARAVLERLEGNAAAAGRTAREALDLIDTKDDPAVPGLYICALIVAAQDPTDLEELFTRLDRASRFASELGMDEMRLPCAVVEARLLRRQGDPVKATTLLRDALELQMDGVVAQRATRLPFPRPYVLAVAFDELIGLLLLQDTPSASAEAWRWTSVSKVLVSDDFAAAILRHRHRDADDAAPDVMPQDGPELVALSQALDCVGETDCPDAPEELQDAQNSVRRALRRRSRQVHDVAAVGSPSPDAPIPEGPLLQFHVLDEDVVVMVIREGQVYAQCVEGAARTSRQLLSDWWVEGSRVTHLGAHDAGTPCGAGTLPTSLRSLGSLLLGPVADLLVDLPEGAPLAVVGHQHLDEVPLEALSFDGLPMYERFALRFVVGLDPSTLWPSGPTVGAVRAGPAPLTRPGVLVLAAPDDRAPAIAAEAHGIARVRPDATVLLGADATAEALATRGRDHGLVHLACHGWFDADQPRGSGVRLGDRWLVAGEIPDLDLADTVVVLNACATGRVAKTGTDMGGLVWSFLAAGAAGVVSSTWPVDDQVALDFGVELHRRLADGAAPSEAVDDARRLVATAHPHPWMWAGFRYTSAADLVLHVR